MSQSMEQIATELRGALGGGEVVGESGSKEPRFELFHAANSICSQKVRAVLAHHGIPYRSCVLNIFEGQTYLPANIRLRLIGCAELGGGLVAGHTGSTSASQGGCDPAVVPTLIDWETGRVLVDSKRICVYVDGIAAGETTLRPQSLQDAIDAEVEFVDNMPNYQMLAGKPPGEDHRPESRRKSNGVGFAMSKVERCDHYLNEFADDADLVRGYSAKRSKELQAAQQLFTPEAMRTAYDKAEAGCSHLEQMLSSGSGWVVGDTMTMADLYWGLELLRMKNMAVESFWTGGAKPAVEAFIQKVESIPAIRSSVIQWPGAMY
ncbi:glutathione S-transferase family protein [Pusillimonas noertemannii]|uniref:2,5-dichlorohydroquinone reductive dechlorinase n=1 Tax=Pusillimonas noertemannii TaxID=305977 RepID=A0A2U1CKI1_9BURK|nr:glutathione S-transferase family protein [Pusillimonas noertemannii]NYT69560.1 glutathione S-transferase family protein [Pusillimonas noertemannii]PVY61516.1 2,5-dichlorohydroquinone reductive dechlorinase [Pusillimonas noertemannii]TFL08894.1 glutathione S-transferase family protein [Pusillimonas noertemannii]